MQRSPRHKNLASVGSHEQGVGCCRESREERRPATADIDARGNIVAQGDVSAASMHKRLQHCLDEITERLTPLELSWIDATHIDLCVARDTDDLPGTLVVPALQGSAARGIGGTLCPAADHRGGGGARLPGGEEGGRWWFRGQGVFWEIQFRGLPAPAAPEGDVPAEWRYLPESEYVNGIEEPFNPRSGSVGTSCCMCFYACRFAFWRPVPPDIVRAQFNP
jgi:hypothetical protein